MKYFFILTITLFLNILVLDAQVSFLENGQTIWLHHLERGEQLTDIASLYGVSIQEI